jgi:hypothetical protein
VPRQHLPSYPHNIPAFVEYKYGGTEEPVEETRKQLNVSNKTLD